MKKSIRLLRRTLRNVKHGTVSANIKLAQRYSESNLNRMQKDYRYRSNNVRAEAENYHIKKYGDFERTSNYAVVLHLYHTDLWNEMFKPKLTMLAKHLDYDLFVTMPENNRDFIMTIRETFPKANVLISQNRGRDVLPFIKAAQILSNMGYEKVLKIHSKKSTHRDGVNISAENGNAWLDNTLDALIPRNEKTLKKLILKLADKKTGMIGPQEYFYPLKTYFGHNREYIRRVADSIQPGMYEEKIIPQIDTLGFFAGTMFWVDLESIQKLTKISLVNFPKENGQTDGTVAHALERLFCIMPQLNRLNMIGIDGDKINFVKGNETRVPDWYYEDVAQGRPPVSIIVPVYADWKSLSLCIGSLSKELGNQEYVNVYFVNDVGPEADILESKILKSIKGYVNFYYHRNKKNLGFVGNCNFAALELVDQRSDVLLLNSDTKVTHNFLKEMREVLYSEDNIGAVTARSNNATIWSVPMTGKFAHHRPLSYALYRTIKADLPKKYTTPTVHGFCLLIRREVIEKYGLFDPIYGKGYGEENDFAMRIQHHGWKCAVANWAYVFHYESKSFGNDVRNAQIEKNEKILTKRYPQYRQAVQEYWDSIKEPMK